MLNEAPENLVTLIKVVSSRLFLLIDDHTFPAAAPSSFSPVANIAATWASVAGSQQRDATKELLNCLRVLGRILPVVFEAETPFEENVLWQAQKKEVNQGPLSESVGDPQFVIQEEDSDEEDNPDTPKAAAPPLGGSKEELEPPLAHRLLATAIDLMFCCGFTIPKSLQVDHHKINYTIWSVNSREQFDALTSTLYSGNEESARLWMLLHLII